MSKNSNYTNNRSEVKRNIAFANERSIALAKDYYDCVNIRGSVDNGGCSAENSLCNCPCTGGSTGASAVPLFREPTSEEMSFAKNAVSQCRSGGGSYDGYLVLDPEALMSNCGVQCHGKDFYSLFQTIRTYSTFWDTPPKVPLYRNALINLYTAEQAVCIIPGNLKVNVGNFIFLPDDGSALSKKYSGGWLIANITHAFASLQQYKMILTLIRDSRIWLKDEEG